MVPSVGLDALEERKSYVPTGSRKTVPWWSTLCYCTNWAIVVFNFEISVNEVCGHVFCLCYSIVGLGAWILEVTRSRRTCTPTEPVNVMKTKTILPVHRATISCRCPFPVYTLYENLLLLAFLPGRLNGVCLHRNRSCLSTMQLLDCIYASNTIYILLSYLKGKKLTNIRIITKYYGACPLLRLLLYQSSSDTIV
jgi:hypothetical protein